MTYFGDQENKMLGSRIDNINDIFCYIFLEVLYNLNEYCEIHNIWFWIHAHIKYIKKKKIQGAVKSENKIKALLKIK